MTLYKHCCIYFFAIITALGFLTLLPQETKAVYAASFTNYGGNPLFYGQSTVIGWYCVDADTVNLYDYYPGYNNYWAPAYAHRQGQSAAITTFPQYTTKTWYYVCQDNALTKYYYATSWGLTITVYPEYCENGLHFQTYSPYSCGCPANQVQAYAGATYCVPAPPPAPSLAAAAYTVPYNTATSLYAYLSPGPAGWSACYLYGGVYGGGTSISAGPGTHSSGNIAGPTTFYAACNDNQWGWYSTNAITLYVNAATVSISASPTTVNYGQSSTVTWSSSDATSCTLYNPASAAVASGLSGSYPTPALTASSNTYTVTCSGPGGSTSVSTAITVNPAVLSLAACNAAGECNAPWVNPGKSAYLTYSAQSVGSCTLVASPGGTIATNTSGTAVSTPALSADTTYTFSCTGAPTPTPVSRGVVVTPACAAQSGIPLTGWAWSEYAGWLSLDCQSAYSALSWPANYDTRNWGVAASADGLLSGYAWSDTIGWVKFGGLSSFPTGLNTVSQNAEITGSGSTATLRGWARACAGTAGGDCSSMTNAGSGWDGWISLAGSTTDSGSYSANFGSNPSYLPQTSGAWMGVNPGYGWFSFNFGALPPPSCNLSAAPFAIGSSTTLSYNSSYSSTATFNQGLGSVTPNVAGTKTTPIILEPTLYTLSLTGFGGSGGCNVLAAPGSGLETYGCLSLNSATCAPPQRQARVSPGSTVSLYWNVQNASTTCAIVGDNGQNLTGLAAQGTTTSAAITARTTFTLSCGGVQIDQGTAVLVPRFQEN